MCLKILQKRRKKSLNLLLVIRHLLLLAVAWVNSQESSHLLLLSISTLKEYLQLRQLLQLRDLQLKHLQLRHLQLKHLQLKHLQLKHLQLRLHLYSQNLELRTKRKKITSQKIFSPTRSQQT